MVNVRLDEGPPKTVYKCLRSGAGFRRNKGSSEGSDSRQRSNITAFMWCDDETKLRKPDNFSAEWQP